MSKSKGCSESYGNWEFIRVRCIPIIHLDVSLDEFAGEEGLQVISDGAAKLVINHKVVIDYIRYFWDNDRSGKNAF